MSDWTEPEHRHDREDDGGYRAHTPDHEHNHDRGRHAAERPDTADAEPVGYRVEEYDGGADGDGAGGDG